MTLDEFTLVEPRLAYSLRLYVGNGDQAIVDGVYRRDDGRWEAHVVASPSYELDVVVEARCKPNCRRGIGTRYIWHYDNHVCCEACEVDSSHHYHSVHE